MPHDRNPLSAALQDLPLQHPEQDRLQAVLAALHANSAKPIPRRKTRTYWLCGLAASVAILGSVWLLHNPNTDNPSRSDAKPPILAQTLNAPSRADTFGLDVTPRRDTEISALIADSQLLETQLRDLGKRRASFRQLNARSQAELSLSALDASLASVTASGQQVALNEQRALWRERVAVLNAVNQGEYRPALYAID
jgi:hypothetical protein